MKASGMLVKGTMSITVDGKYITCGYLRYPRYIYVMEN
jgi:hypothetical protein